MGDELRLRDMLAGAFEETASVGLWRICFAVGAGLGIGVLLAQYNTEGDSEWPEWIALPGDLFIDALKCLIVPMVFSSIVVCIGELVEAGKAARIGSRVMIYFAMSSLVSSTIGMLFGVLFSGMFVSQIDVNARSIPVPQFSIKCANGKYLVPSGANGGMALACTALSATTSDQFLIINSTDNFFTPSEVGLDNLDVTEQIFSIFHDLVPDNLIASFAGTSTLSVITFAIFFGAAIVKSYDKQSGAENYALLMVMQISVVSRMMVNYVIKFIPIAIVSMIAGSITSYASSLDLLQSVGFLILALFVALVTLTIGIMGTALFMTTGRNVFSYLKHIVPAQLFIFGCSSSIATLPMTMRCVDETKEISYALSRFVLPLGATSNLNGSAAYMTLVCVFMAKVGGYEELLSPIRYVLLAFVGAIASFGVAPVPHSGLVMAITVWRTTFGVDVPSVFSVLVSFDWILNRMRAVVNITNDTILVRIIAAQCDETVLHELKAHTEQDLRASPRQSV